MRNATRQRHCEYDVHNICDCVRAQRPMDSQPSGCELKAVFMIP